MPASIQKIANSVTAVLLLLCLFHMPYGYYIFIRYVAMVMFGVLAVLYFSRERIALGVVFAALAVLFQPFVKFALGKMMWNVVDVACAVLLIGIIFYENSINNKQ